jgi:hypothetical protein
MPVAVGMLRHRVSIPQLTVSPAVYSKILLVLCRSFSTFLRLLTRSACFPAPNGNGMVAGPPAVVASGSYPAQNAQGQRICRQCGLPGRYKDGKCVEKWGPGPEGPGTVCDRFVVSYDQRNDN